MNAPLTIHKRKPLTRLQRVSAHDEHGGLCIVCLLPIAPGEPFIDEHVIPLALGGSNDRDNRGIAHIQCAKIKTQRDRKMIDKSMRQRAKHLGIRKSKHPMRGWRKFNKQLVINPKYAAQREKETRG